MSSFNFAQAKEYLQKEWEATVIPTLSNYIRIENQTPAYDPKNLYAKEAAEILAKWVTDQKIAGTTVSVEQLEESIPPIVLVEVAATKPGNVKSVFLYGHYDKQPPMEGKWTPPHDHPRVPYLDPVTKRLFGRGGADDGYAIFASLTSIIALKQQNILHDRYVVLIEGEEESGSPNLARYVEKFAATIGNPDLVVCLDSGSGNFTQLWLTTSLRGIVNGTLNAKILEIEAHSGSASGIVPSSFHIQRTLIDRLETSHAGVISHLAFHVEITPDIREQAEAVKLILGAKIWTEFQFVSKGRPITEDLAELYINKTFRPTLSITGSNLPTISGAGNVLRTNTELVFSIRIPPGIQAEEAAKNLKQILEAEPKPFGADVTYTATSTGNGWKASAPADWLQTALKGVGDNFFGGEKVVSWGEGGSIPFINTLAVKFPNAQFVVTGVLGPGSNAHAPDEFLDTIYAKAITGGIAYILYELSLKA